MQSKQLDSYITTLGSRLKAMSKLQREEEMHEVRQHLEALVVWHMQQGQNQDEAVRLAIRQFGQAERIGGELNQASVRTRINTVVNIAGKFLVFWFCIATTQFLFFTSMNDKPTDFPYTLEDRLLRSAVLATGALVGFYFVMKNKKRNDAKRTA